MSIISLAIKTIPDIETGRRLHQIKNLSDAGVAKAMFHLQQQRSGSENLPLYLQRIVSIALLIETNGKTVLHQLSLDSRGKADEKHILQSYIQSIAEANNPKLLSWQGLSYELPVLRYRALKHGLSLPNSEAHQDLSQLFADQSSTVASLSNLACLLNLDVLSSFDMPQTWQAYLAGEQDRIDQAAQAEVKVLHEIYQRI